jgi:hypothetical protein
MLRNSLAKLVFKEARFNHFVLKVFIFAQP